jgi:hypothetical protein
MKNTPIPPVNPPMFIRSVSISTNIRLHPEFVASPHAFARRHKVDLANDVFPATHFKKNRTKDPDDPDDPGSEERIEVVKSNIHLVRHGAIRLFTERDDEADWIRSIDLNPSMLLYDAKRHALAAGDLPRSLSVLRDKVTKLLADPLDARHIVPGLLQDGEPVAYWSEVDTEFQFPGIAIRCLHGLSHPLTGPAEGAKPNRIQLGDKKDDCLIRIKKAKWEIDGPDGAEAGEGIRVRLILKGRALTDEFRTFAKSAEISNTWRVVELTMPGAARVHQSVMAHLEGTYLPVPAEWRNRRKGHKALTHAKSMALVSQLTSIPLEEIRAMDEEIRHPSESTRERLDEDLPVEVRRLAPVPVATLFHPSAYTFPNPGTAHPADGIDPLIAEAYGEPDALSD